MKKIFFLLFLATATTFTSCKKDDDNVLTTAELLIGSWEFTHEGVILGGTEFLEAYDHDAPECGMDHIVFNNNNTGATYYFENYSGCETDIEPFTYTLNGNNITITEDGDSETGTIMSIDSANLKVKFSEEFDGTTIDYVIVMKRK